MSACVDLARRPEARVLTWGKPTGYGCMGRRTVRASSRSTSERSVSENSLLKPNGDRGYKGFDFSPLN